MCVLDIVVEKEICLNKICIYLDSPCEECGCENICLFGRLCVENEFHCIFQMQFWENIGHVHP